MLWVVGDGAAGARRDARARLVVLVASLPQGLNYGLNHCVEDLWILCGRSRLRRDLDTASRYSHRTNRANSLSCGCGARPVRGGRTGLALRSMKARLVSGLRQSRDRRVGWPRGLVAAMGGGAGTCPTTGGRGTHEMIEVPTP